MESGPAGLLSSVEHDSMDWPAHYPENCPPRDARPAGGLAYRLTHDPVELEDFLSLRERKPEIRLPDPIQECRASGLSVFRDIEDARRLRRRVPHFRNKQNAIAVGQLSPEFGLMKATYSRSHCTWWVPNGVDRTSPFTILEE